MIATLASPKGTAVEVLAVTWRSCLLRAAILRSHLAWARQRPLVDIEDLWGRMPNDMKSRRPETIHDDEWIPFASLILFDKAVVRACRDLAEDAVLFSLGRASAEQNFGGGLGLERGVNIHSHFWDAGTHHARFQDFGKCEYEPMGARSFRMTYSDYPVKSRIFCLSACGYFQASIEFLGGQDAIVEERLCQCLGDDRCTFLVSWEGR
ncbi:MAG TPA: hypothetical protein VGR00_14030 [Thermoanaerobaculia bacterium]|nr:hypothetical protein [Thermoanaerobaculia bacterium]